MSPSASPPRPADGCDFAGLALGRRIRAARKLLDPLGLFGCFFCRHGSTAFAGDYGRGLGRLNSVGRRLWWSRVLRRRGRRGSGLQCRLRLIFPGARKAVVVAIIDGRDRDARTWVLQQLLEAANGECHALLVVLLFVLAPVQRCALHREFETSGRNRHARTAGGKPANQNNQSWAQRVGIVLTFDAFRAVFGDAFGAISCVRLPRSQRRANHSLAILVHSLPEYLPGMVRRLGSPVIEE